MRSKGFNGFEVFGSVKEMFFDRDAVINAISTGDRRRLSKAGAFIRRRARSMLRFRKRSASPGQPPSVRSRDSFSTLRNVLFALGDDQQSVVVGPRAVPSLRLRKASTSYVPALLEFGGTAEVRGRRCRYAAFPFMQPALEAEVQAGTIGSLWVNRG